MVFWLCAACTVLILAVLLLLIKIRLLRKAAEELRTEFTARLQTETNVLLDCSSNDPSMKRLALALNEQLRLLREQRRRFQTGDLRLKEAVTNISHDLRTPLTAICGYLDLLRQEDTSETVQRYLQIIQERITVMTQLTEELFRYTVTLASGPEAALEPVILNHILEESIAAYYAVLHGKGIVPVIQMPAGNVERRLNAAYLRRIFDNILSNAVKYSTGGLSITLLETGEITFINTAGQMTAVMAGRLFDRYFTVETGNASTGLGLSIAKQFTEQLGGTISAEYKNGTLRISLQFPQ